MRRYKHIIATITSPPNDDLTRKSFPVGSVLVIPKKKYPYFIRSGKIQFKFGDTIVKLLRDEIELIAEKNYEIPLKK